MLDKIIESIPNIEEFNYTFGENLSMVTKSTVKNIANLKNLQHLSNLLLWNIPETLNLEDLSLFIKNRINTKFLLTFCDNISEQYKDQLNALIDTIIKSKFSSRQICYAGQNREKEHIMSCCYDYSCNRYH
uniref:Uncharacterized protein n=1 Tax=Panagrolaimus sp. ES5 TaxID=591445 RepID=A0AC34FL45_9BILA